MKKISGLIFFSLLVLYLKDAFLLTVIFILLFLALNIWPPKRPVIERLHAIMGAGIFIILFQLIFHPSPDLMTRFVFGYTVFIRILIISFSMLFFMSFTSSSEIIAVFRFLPEKMQLMLTITFYFIPAILEESARISQVQKSRGQIKGMKAFFSLMIPLLHRVLQRAETLSLTIVSRGYGK